MGVGRGRPVCVRMCMRVRGWGRGLERVQRSCTHLLCVSSRTTPLLISLVIPPPPRPPPRRPTPAPPQRLYDSAKVAVVQFLLQPTEEEGMAA